MNLIKPLLYEANQVHQMDQAYLINLVDHFNLDIAELNDLISTYNNATEPKECIEKLKNIFGYIKLLENKHSDQDISLFTEYSAQIFVRLFSELQAEFAKYGIVNLQDISDVNPPPSLEAQNHFSKILTNMAPEKIKKLITILSDGPYYKKRQLQLLYFDNEKGCAEFNDFLINNNLSYLGGGNSKNFKITPYDGSPAYVLKIENRMGMPQQPAFHLKNTSLRDIFIPVAAERLGTTCNSSGEIITRTILTTEFCASGNLVEHSSHYGNDDLMRTLSAINIYMQMADILIKISENGCAFPDMKNSNWLINQNDNLKIADTKSFIFCEKDGDLDYPKIKVKSNKKFLHTKFLNPPEIRHDFYQGQAISVDKMHAYMLGKNLYQYLTQSIPKNFKNIHEGSDLNFNYPIFNTNEGKELAKLIKNLIRATPDDRISLTEAKTQLTKLYENQLDIYKNYALKLLDDMEEYGLPIGDVKIDDFIHQKKDLIANCNDQQEFRKMCDELKNILQQQIRVNALQKETLILVDNIKKQGFGPQDIRMNEFIVNKKQLIAQCNSINALEELKKELNFILTKQKVVDKIKIIIQGYRDKAGTFTVGMKAKADKIEKAVCDVSVGERYKIMDPTHKFGLNVQLAMVSHRFFTSASHLIQTNKNNNKMDKRTISQLSKHDKNKLNALKVPDDMQLPKVENKKSWVYK